MPVASLFIVTIFYEVKTEVAFAPGRDPREDPQRDARDLWPGLPAGTHARHRRRALERADPARPVPAGSAQVPGSPDLAGRHQPEHAVGAAEAARGRGHHRAPD